MTNGNDGKRLNWPTAAIGGGIVAVLLAIVGAGPVAAIVAGVAILAIGLVLLPRTGTSVHEETRVIHAPPTGAPRAVSRAPTPARPLHGEAPEPVPVEDRAAFDPATDTAPQDVAEEKPAPVTDRGPFASTRVKASRTLPGQQELAARKGTWRFDGNAGAA